MRIEKCYFCSSNVYPGHGIVFVRNDAKVSTQKIRLSCNFNDNTKSDDRDVRILILSILVMPVPD